MAEDNNKNQNGRNYRELIRDENSARTPDYTLTDEAINKVINNIGRTTCLEDIEFW